MRLSGRQTGIYIAPPRDEVEHRSAVDAFLFGDQGSAENQSVNGTYVLTDDPERYELN